MRGWTAEGGSRGRREVTGGDEGRKRGEEKERRNLAPRSFLKVGAYAKTQFVQIARVNVAIVVVWFLQTHTNGVLETQLYMRRATPESFRTYEVIAQNDVATKRQTVQLSQSMLPCLHRFTAARRHSRSNGGHRLRIIGGSGGGQSRIDEAGELYFHFHSSSSLPPLSSLFSIPSYPLPFPFLSLEVGAVKYSYGVWPSGECCKLPQRGLGRSPSGNRIWCILALKFDIWRHQFYYRWGTIQTENKRWETQCPAFSTLL